MTHAIQVAEAATGTKEVVHCSHVCGYWRNVTLTRPGLWATIRHDGDKNKFELFNLALRRVGTVPLDITVSLGPEPQWIAEELGPSYDASRSIDSKEAMMLLACIVGLSKQIRRLDMTIGGYWPPEDIAPLFSELRLPVLERIRFFDSSGGYRLGTECPKLRVAEFIQIFPEVSPTSFPFLEKLVLRKVSVREHALRSALDCLPRLHTLELWSVALLESGSTPQHVRLPAKLYFRGMTPEDMLTLMSNVEAGAEDVTSYAPLRAWNYFARIYDVLAFHVISHITSVIVRRTEHVTIDDGPPLMLTIKDRKGHHRAMTIPAHVEALWNTLATRLKIFETAQYWYMHPEDLIALQKFNPVFAAATAAIFNNHGSRAGASVIPSTSWPVLRKVIVICGKVLVKLNISDGTGSAHYVPWSANLAAKLINSLNAPMLEVVRLQGISQSDWADELLPSAQISPSIRLEFQ